MTRNLVDPMPLHPLLCYPGTRKPLRAVGLRADGSPLWPLCGGDGDDDGGTDDGGEDDGADDEGAEEDDDDAGDGSADDSAKNGKSKKSGPVSREEFDAVTKRLSAADKRRSEAEKTAAALQKEKDDAERKGKPELENVKKDLVDVTAERDSYRDRFTNLARTNAFLTASAQAKITWHDPEDAQAAAGKALRDLEIDDDGNVDGITEFVKDLAKRKKYLVDSGKNNEQDDDEGKQTARRGASGSGVGSVRTKKGAKKPGQFSDEELRTRFPALKTR